MKQSPLKIGLGDAFLLRARIIFLLLLFIFIGGGAFAIYWGNKTGKLDQYILSPFKATVAGIYKMFEPTPAPSFAPVIYTEQPDFSPSPSPAVGKNQPAPATKQPANSNQAYEDAVKAQEEWFKKAQEENKQKSEQAQQEYDQFVKDSNARYEEFKNKNP